MVTELWYSTLLSQSTYNCLTKTLTELINIPGSEYLKSTTAGLVCIDKMHLEELKDVWRKWLALNVQGTGWIQKKRMEVLNSQQLINIGTLPMFTDIVPTAHTDTAKKWLEDGVFRRTQMKKPAFAENPTLTGYDPTSKDAPYSYRIQQGTYPFCGWDYVQAKKFKNSSCLVTMFGDYIESILRSFKNKLSTHKVSLQIVLCDCIDIKQHLELNAMFDRILTSNLMDYIILPVLLKLCSEILNHSNACATIITETIRWIRDFCPPVTSQESKMLKFLEADVERSPEVQFRAHNFGECIDNSSDFYDYLRALFCAHQMREKITNESNSSRYLNIPTVKNLGSKLKLRLRDGCRNENKIVFFKLAVNMRRVNLLSGEERFLEWIPLHNE